MDGQLVKETRRELNKRVTKIAGQKAFVGLDGYVDLIQRAVKTQSADGPVFFSTIAAFSSHLAGAAGKSAQIELITQETKLGGNAPIMAHALGTLGIKTTCLGNFGEASMHPVFEEIDDSVIMLSLGDPAMTNALEFDDGKLILSEVGPFKALDWDFVKSVASLERIKSAIDVSGLVALVDWCNLPNSTQIWQGMAEEVLPALQEKERHFFFDIADPSRRSDKEIMHALQVIGRFRPYGKVTLGLNENETEKLSSCLRRINGEADEPGQPITTKGKYIFLHTELSHLLIHPTDRSICISDHATIELQGRIVDNPKISTGGGDNFNAGFCLGQLIGVELAESMVLGMANSGSYVQNGQSSSLQDLDQYLKLWTNEIQ